MKTIYQADSNKQVIEIVEIMLDGKHFQVVLTNEPEVIDTIVCTTDELAPDTLLILHTSYASWTTDPDWRKEHPHSGSGDQPAGSNVRQTV